jgi:hypothetical protein
VTQFFVQYFHVPQIRQRLGVKKPLVGQITEFLTQAIIEGRLEGGQRLVGSELQRKFGISRTPIRQSFRKDQPSAISIKKLYE